MSHDPYAHGLKLAAEGRHIQAIEAFERALALKPDDSRTLFALGNTARALGLAGPAEQFYRRVLAAEPERLEALVNLANLLRAEADLVVSMKERRDGIMVGLPREDRSVVFRPVPWNQMTLSDFRGDAYGEDGPDIQAGP